MSGLRFGASLSPMLFERETYTASAGMEWYVWEQTVRKQQRDALRKSFGPKAPLRRRPKRVAKKLAKRGGMLRCNGLMQSFYAAWPELGRVLAASRSYRRGQQ